MKKLRFCFILLLCLGVFLCLGAAANAEPAVLDSGNCGAEGDNLTWTLYDTGELVIDGTGNMADYGGGATPWYKNRLKISSVTISDGVTSISNNAFLDCSSLTSVTIPEGVTSIGSSAFQGCSSLTSVTIPESVTSIGDVAFGGCSGLTSVTIPEGVTSIGHDAFDGCTALTDVCYGGSEAQWNSISIENYNDPLINATIHYAVIDSGICGAEGDNLTWTLYDTGELVIDGTGNMASYGEGTAPWYKNRLKISSVTIHDGVTSIGNYAFYANIKLEAVSIPKTVAEIGIHAFDNCVKLANVTIPEGVTYIVDYAFQNCSSLTSVTIPDSVTIIGSYAFRGCSSLTSVTIPDSVTSIYYDAFSGCSSLMSVTIPEGVTSIRGYTFNGCSSLTSVTIPSGVTDIGNYAFFGCRSLTSATIPESVTSIGDDAFASCSGLTSVTIPEGVTSIRNGVFEDCSSLTSVTIPESVTSISSYAFLRCSSLTSVTIPEGVTSISGSAFKGCSSLTSVTIPEGVTSISGSAFEGCSSLTSVTIPEGVTSIGERAFYWCALKDVCYGGSKERWDGISIGSYNDPLKNATIHYNWTPEAYTVTFNANGGTGDMATQTFTIDIPQTLTANAFSRTGYTFAGWAASANGEVLYTDRQNVKNLSSTPGTTVNLYAVWTSITEPDFTGYSLRLSGILGLKYYMALPESFKGSDASMTFTIKGKTQTVPFSEGYDENGCRVFECSVYAYQMADDIKAVFHYGDGKTITDTYSVENYLDSIREGDYTGAAKTLVNAARAYGHFIQPYLADVNGWTYGEKYKALDYNGTVDVDAARDGSDAYKYNLSVWDMEKVDSASYKLYLNADTILRVEVTLKDTPADTVKLTVDGTETAATVIGNTYRVEIPDIAANELGTAHSVVMTLNDTEVFNISLSAMSFANTVLTLSEDQNELNAMAAMYEYYIAANNYMN